MAIRTPDPVETVNARIAGNSIQKIARSPAPLVTDAPYTHIAVLRTLYRATNEQTLGPELVTNGGFDADTDWTKGAGWTIAGGVANNDGQVGRLAQNFGGIALGAVHRVSFSVANGTYGVNGLQVQLGGLTTVHTVYADGDYLLFMRPTAGGSAIGFNVDPENGFIGDLDNVSVKEIIPL